MSLKITTAAAVAALLVGITASPAFANDRDNKQQPERMKADHYFERIDTNRDGFISKAESNAFGNRMFAETDQDKDGRMSRDEMMMQKQKEMDVYRSTKGIDKTSQFHTPYKRTTTTTRSYRNDAAGYPDGSLSDTGRTPGVDRSADSATGRSVNDD